LSDSKNFKEINSCKEGHKTIVAKMLENAEKCLNSVAAFELILNANFERQSMQISLQFAKTCKYLEILR
jgi:hypothetical protein